MNIKRTLKCTFLILAFLFCTQVFALESVQYRNLRNGKWISLSGDNQTWLAKCDKNGTCYKREILYNDSQGSVYYAKSKEVAFATECQYEFIKNGKLIGYSNTDLTFYDISLNSDSVIEKRPLSYDEVSELFKNYKIIKISDFNNVTNSIKIKKGNKNLNLILYNDKNMNFAFYDYGTYNAKLEKYPLKGFLKVKRAGMIHFSHYGDNTKDNPLYVILVR